MKGFREFILRGNLLELAVGFIMATAFNAVVTAFTGLIIQIIGAIVGAKSVGAIMAGPVDLGPFVNAVIAFLIIAAVVYFAIVVPYTAWQNRGKTPEQIAAESQPLPSSEELLIQIRDLLAQR